MAGVIVPYKITQRMFYHHPRLILLKNKRKTTAFVLFILFAACKTPEKRSDLIALSNFKILNLADETVLRNEVVLLKEDSIFEILSEEEFKKNYILPDSAIVNGKGKYLMPSLVEMHAHFQPRNQHHKRYLQQYLSYGITQIRVMAGNEDLLSWKDSIAQNLIMGPDLKVAGPLIDGEKPLWGKFHDGPVITNTGHADSLISEIKAKGYDLVKLYERLPAKVYFEFIEAAKKQEMRVAAHIPFEVLTSAKTEEVFNTNSPSFEHFKNFGPLVTKNEVEKIAQPEDHIYYGYRLAEDPDLQKIYEVVKEIKQNQVWTSPTAVLWKNSSDSARIAAIMKTEAYKGLDEGMKNWWRSTIENQSRNMVLNRLNELLLKEMARQEVKLLVGTDFPNPFIIPGYAVHQEIHNLVDMGFSNLEALRAATIYPAQYWEEKDPAPYFTQGRLANFLILNKNPLEHIENTFSIHRVVKKGEFFSPKTLRE